ncbi:YjgP/YjgQ family permease [Mucilaginibacter corticis]|uniref:YjgP/YjgQ family permease n=1 Tax=Mucilaginibacter corticis TaxID=2597670 RepID=A0A556MVS0_9SPHI|nr:LptF/LptG family permease [Mucilaginibacter corticis]TSJ44007.1 YjgP/YjgQ family permease [Mucilaginibacter corticis]
MKKLHLLLIKSFIRPFIVTFMIVMFVLLMLFLWKYIDDLIGKGFEWYVIMELMLYASATNVAMALPLSVLLSSIMTYGSLGENYELVAIKSAGISLTRAVAPMFIVVIILSVAAFFFSEYMLPKANLKYYSLLWDAREQKSANFLPEGVFSNSFPNYTIRVEKKDDDGQTLHDVTVYSKSTDNTPPFVLKSKTGKMYRSNDNRYLILEFQDGIRYEESPGGSTFNPDPRQKFTRWRFKYARYKLDLKGLAFNRTSESSFKSAFQMMDTKQLKDTMKQMQHLIDSSANLNLGFVRGYMKYYSIPAKPFTSTIKGYTKYNRGIMSDAMDAQKQAYLTSALSEARSIQDLLKQRSDRLDDFVKSFRSAFAQYQVKFTLSVSCLALFLIGAPMGAIIRKGGLGLPVVISVIFFLIFYIIKTIGEKAAHEGNLSGIAGAWISILVITPVGIFLSYKASTDSTLFDAESYKRFFEKLFSVFKKKQDLK